MTENPKLLALGVASGYLLGRTRKAKLALAVASMVVGRRMGLGPQHLLTEGLKKLNDTPEFARLNEQVRDELLSAGRSMVTAAANRRLDSLSDALRDRTEALSPQGESEEPEEEEEPEKATGKKAPEKPEKPEKKAPPSKTTPEETTPKKAAAKKSTAEKTASRKTAATKSTARGTTGRTASRSTGRR